MFSNLPLVIVVAAVTLVVGAGLLQDGFLEAAELQRGTGVRPLPLKRVRQFVGGALLLGYLLAYVQPQGTLLQPWPVAPAITAILGVIMIAYAVVNR